jgi:hypothetical protein
MLDERIIKYLNELNESDREICSRLTELIIDELSLAENKLWHGHPVWFINDNPITGFSIQNKGVRLMFWSGADFEENQLNVRGQKFKDASIFYSSIDEINSDDLRRWLQKSILIQWDYKNLIKRKGQLTKLTP